MRQCQNFKNDRPHKKIYDSGSRSVSNLDLPLQQKR